MKKALYVKHTFLVWAGQTGNTLTPLYICLKSEKDKEELYFINEFHAITNEPLYLKALTKEQAMELIDVSALSCAY